MFDEVLSLAKCQAWARYIDTQRQDLVSYDANQQNTMIHLYSQQMKMNHTKHFFIHPGV